MTSESFTKPLARHSRSQNARDEAFDVSDSRCGECAVALIGYVSDEWYVGLSDVSIELTGQDARFDLRSSASGAVVGDVPPGRYLVTLATRGYGSKRVAVDVGNTVHQFRMLSDDLLGYVWPKWARSGEEGEPRIHSAEMCRLSLSRYGREVEAEQIVGWLDEHGPRAMAQVTPDGDYTQTGVNWNRIGYGRRVFRPKVRAPERSGLYYFHAETESGKWFAFPWVVAPAQPRSRLAVLASTNTWNAYNNFGGRSNYINAAGLPPVPTVSARADLKRYREGSENEYDVPNDAYPPLSFERPEPENQVRRGERPTDPIRGRMTCAMAPAEWRLLSWLERQEFAYDLYADGQLHDGTLNLDDYRVLILNTHPEYWSREMVQALTLWVENRGGRLVYLEGTVSIVRWSSWIQTGCTFSPGTMSRADRMTPACTGRTDHRLPSWESSIPRPAA